MQSGFVDDPPRTVNEANALVGEVVDRLTERLESERSSLPNGSDDGKSTEDLRVALQSYRSLLFRLLDV